MSLTDIAHRVNELTSSWEQFKLINDRKLIQIIEDCDRAGAGWSGEVVDDEDGGYKSKYDWLCCIASVG